MQKNVVYCRSIDTVSEIFLTIKLALGVHAYANEIQYVAHLLVEMYHKSTHPDSKARILSEFKKRDGHIRCLTATVALGMGVDVRDIDMVVHIGCPKSVISYWQEAGKCARDGRQGYALIIYDNFTLSMKSNNKNISDIIKNIDKKCIRQQIIDVLSLYKEVSMLRQGGRSTSTNFYNLKVRNIIIQWFDMYQTIAWNVFTEELLGNCVKMVNKDSLAYHCRSVCSSFSGIKQLRATQSHIYSICYRWLLSRFWVYCKLYHSLATFHCLTMKSHQSKPRQ